MSFGCKIEILCLVFKNFEKKLGGIANKEENQKKKKMDVKLINNFYILF